VTDVDRFAKTVIPDLIRNPGFPMKIGAEAITGFLAFAGTTNPIIIVKKC
jgi:hypothetical protein